MTRKVRAIGYGRFSDEKQNATSTADQGRNIGLYAAERGMDLVSYFHDEAITGATMARPGLQEMIAAVEAGDVDVVIIEDVDRLGRDEEYLQYLKKLFARRDVVLHTVVGGGPIDDLLFSFKGIISESHRKKIAYWSRRGLIGKAGRGGFTGGRTLGYAREVTATLANGGQEDRIVIDAAGAELVLTIFQMYADGFSLKQICAHLDQSGVETPGNAMNRKKASIGWNPSSLSGNIERGEGILNNRLYIGERIFNRRRYIEEPDGKGGITRRPRDNDPSLWKITPMPELRIIPDDLWIRVKERQATERARRDGKFRINKNPLAGAKRPSYLLSELVVCGECGDRYVASGGGRWRCRVNFRKAGCSNKRSITTNELEGRVLAGLKGRLLTPDLIARFTRLLQKEIANANREREHGKVAVEHELFQVRARIDKLVRQIEEDEEAPKALVRRLKALELDEERLCHELEAVPAVKVIQLPANYAKIYEQAVGDLQRHLSGDDAVRARETIRAVIEKVIVRPTQGRQERLDLELHGDLFRMIEFAEAASAPAPKAKAINGNGPQLVAGGRMIPLVAGAGFEPATFRL